ncbi:MAG TPA: RidA family protein [Xanthobacteraceae bacterium]|nr:RidA family protein [Xanthobacteraceae bacterium]
MKPKQARQSRSVALSRRAVMRSAATIAATAGLAAEASAQSSVGGNSSTRFVQPDTIFKTTTYTHVVEVTGPGRLIYTSGEQGRDPDGHFPPDIAGQAIQAFENIKAALAAVGATFDNVVKLNVYMLDLRKHQPIFSEIKQRYVNKSAPPASTTVQVALLTRDDALVEVEAVAALPSG